MAKRVVQQRNMITREVLIEELSSLEQRMDAKIESTALSFKEYVDSRIAPIHVGIGTMQGDIQGMKGDVQGLKVEMDVRFNKLEGYFEGLAGMVVGQGKKIDKVLDKVDDHDRRIKILESKN